MIVKVCGITTKETARVVEASGADFIGFVFAPSKREISPADAKEIAKVLSSHIKKVGVFVNESVDRIIEIADLVGLDFIQLHGDEPDTIANSIPYPIIKAFVIDQVDVNSIKNYPCDYILIDSPGKKYRGGSGETFHWGRLDELGIDKDKLILAGGLSPENIQEAIITVKPVGVDVSSGVETNGIKDHHKINYFVENVRKSC